MTQSVTQGSTTTYAYDYAGNRVSQTVGSTTTIDPNKFYSVTSSTNGANTYSTTTVYVWNGDTLVATIDQAFINGTATGTAATRYFHPDHLGSTNIVTDENGNIADDVEYYPYGETRLNQPTYPTNENRRFIGQFSDANNLQYLNARYLNSQQGQFLSEDPVFLGNPAQQDLQNPQDLNSYGYAADNPITRSDPTGLWYKELLTGQQSWSSFQGEWNSAASQLSQQNPSWKFAMDHPVATGAATALISGAAVISGVDALVAYKTAGTAWYSGAGSSYVGQQLFAGSVYTTLTAGTLNSISGTIQSMGQANFSDPSTFMSTGVSLSFNVGPTYIGGYTGSISDAAQFVSMLSQGVKLLANKIAFQPQGTSPSQPNARSGSGGGGSALPATVTQGGVTYYRNSSELLSTKPGL
jgi:RHS repeat-associated protein